MKYATTTLILALATVGLSGQTIVTLPDDRLALSLETSAGAFYSIRQSSSLEGIAEGPILTTAEGTGSSLGPILPLDPDVLRRAFYHITTETLTARPTTSANLFANTTLLGFNLLPNNRWSFFGVGGDFEYQVTSAQEGTLLFTLDEFRNNPEAGVITADLDFGSDGDLSTVVASLEYPGAGRLNGVQETQTLNLRQDSLAPGDLIFDLLAGGPYQEYDFISRTRFIFGGNEPGNYAVSRPSDDQVVLTLTYDEDGNNPAVFREVFTLTFNGSEDVPVFFESFENNFRTVGQSAGTIRFVPD